MNISVATLYNQYIQVFPQEVEMLAPLKKQLDTKSEEGITNRKTFDTGHITAGSVVVSLPSKKVLLIDHAVLLRQLQPGGHVESEDDTLLDAAYRECFEEAGIPREALHYIPLSEQNADLPFAISVQDIPANTAKAEPRHNHYDCWYLFTAPDGTEVHSDDDGASNPQWTAFTTFAQGIDYSRHAEKIDKLLATS